MKTLKMLMVMIALASITSSCKKNPAVPAQNPHTIQKIPPINIGTEETDNEPVPLKGNIKNQQSAAVPNANVYLYSVVSSVSTLIDSTVSNVDGFFIFNEVYFGDYIVSVVASGYNTKNVNCSMPLVALELDLGDIILD